MTPATRIATAKRTTRRRMLLVQPDPVVAHLELGLVDVALHPRLRDLVERRAGDGVPVELLDRVLLQLLGDGLALDRIQLARVTSIEVVDLRVGVARAVPARRGHR